MYVSNMTHFLDDQGNIPKQMPKEARELANFLALVVDVITKSMSLTLSATDIRCFSKGCHGIIKSAFRPANGEIHWYCPVCENEGVISHWEGTKWDNRNKK
jgi:hypothetical protein